MTDSTLPDRGINVFVGIRLGGKKRSANDVVEERLYSLSDLPYDYDVLEPHISEAQLRLHHDKHHAAYVNGANAILERQDKARKAGTDVDMKAALKDGTFRAGGHLLHSLFWSNLVSAAKAGKVPEPGGALADALKGEFFLRLC